MTVAVYARVSTAEQNLDRQLQATHEYANETLDSDFGEIETYRDKSTGTNTSRSVVNESADLEAEGIGRDLRGLDGDRR